MKLRWAKPEDVKQIVDWSLANAERSQFDPQTLTYPLLDVICAENGKAVLYVPVQLVAMIEALAPNPEATQREKNMALFETVQALFKKALASGIKEVYFCGTHEALNVEAEKFGFEKLDWPIYRMRL